MLIAVVYYSATGITHQIAAAICAGINSVESDSCRLLRIDAEHVHKCRFNSDEIMSVVDQADAVIFGSPTFMGGPAAQFKAFADASSDQWETQLWDGKLAAGFTVGSNLGGDQLSTLQYFTILASQHGMLWINLAMQNDPPDTDWALGTQIGFAACVTGDSISESDRRTATGLGKRVAITCGRLSDAKV